MEKSRKKIPSVNGLLSKRLKDFFRKDGQFILKKPKLLTLGILMTRNLLSLAAWEEAGTTILGFSNFFVDKLVIEKINLGINATLNCREEYEPAEELLKSDKFANQIKFARGGAEVMTLAIRIAIVSSKKKILIYKLKC